MFSILNRSIPQSSRLILNENKNYFIFIALDSKLRHNTPLDYFSRIFHHIFTNNSLDSLVYIAPSAEAHTKSSNCWINKDFLRSCYRNYHKCIRSENFRKSQTSRRFLSIENFKMVWITDLDNPQVSDFNMYL